MQNKRLEQLQEFLLASPKDSFLVYAIATEYTAMGNDIKALEYFTRLIESDPAYVGTYYHLGKLYERMGDRDKAGTTYQEGMAAAQDAGDNHSLAELKAAFNELIGIEEEDY